MQYTVSSDRDGSEEYHTNRKRFTYCWNNMAHCRYQFKVSFKELSIYQILTIYQAAYHYTIDAVMGVKIALLREQHMLQVSDQNCMAFCNSDFNFYVCFLWLVLGNSETTETKIYCHYKRITKHNVFNSEYMFTDNCSRHD